MAQDWFLRQAGLFYLEQGGGGWTIPVWCLPTATWQTATTWLMCCCWVLTISLKAAFKSRSVSWRNIHQRAARARWTCRNLEGRVPNLQPTPPNCTQTRLAGQELQFHQSERRKRSPERVLVCSASAEDRDLICSLLQIFTAATFQPALQEDDSNLSSSHFQLIFSLLEIKQNKGHELRPGSGVLWRPMMSQRRH